MAKRTKPGKKIAVEMLVAYDDNTWESVTVPYPGSEHNSRESIVAWFEVEHLTVDARFRNAVVSQLLTVGDAEELGGR